MEEIACDVTSVCVEITNGKLLNEDERRFIVGWRQNSFVVMWAKKHKSVIKNYQYKFKRRFLSTELRLNTLLKDALLKLK